jgi:hypothetical protein
MLCLLYLFYPIIEAIRRPERVEKEYLEFQLIKQEVDGIENQSKCKNRSAAAVE